MDDIIAIVIQYLRAARRKTGESQRSAVNRAIRALQAAMGETASLPRRQPVRVKSVVERDDSNSQLAVGDLIELQPASGPKQRVTVTRLSPLMAVDQLKQPMIVESPWVKVP